MSSDNDLLTKAQAFVDRKYVARADERQKSMGLAYVEPERQDLAREIVRFVQSLPAPAQAAKELPLWQSLQLGMLLGRLSDWRNADHEDALTLCRSDVIAILDGFKAKDARPQAANETSRETERTAFINAYPNLDLTEVSDAWGRPIFKHSHVQALWDCWLASATRPERG